MSSPIRILTRVTIELDGPAQIGAGDEGIDSDMPFVVDANGLPAIPGSTLAGLLRAGLRASDGRDEAARWFGAEQSSDEPRASQVRFSWGHIHDQDNRPVDCQLHPKDRSDFLAILAAGEVRDHVRIDHRGVAADAGKYDRQVLYGGTRFSFDIEILANEDEDEQAQSLRDRLLALLQGPTTRLGAATHSGFGAFHIHRAQGRRFDLRDGSDFKDYTNLSPALDNEWDFPNLAVDTDRPPNGGVATIDISLTPETFFFVGGGEAIEGSDEESAKIAPVTTRAVRWIGDQGSFRQGEFAYLPASSLKGAIAHRVAFHANRFQGHFIEADKKAADFSGEENAAIRELFGFRRDNADGEETSGVGKVILDDIPLKRRRRKTMIHISTDPFTAGVRQGFLFTEDAFAPGGDALKFSLVIENPQALSDLALRSLNAALDDLIKGRLAIGSGEGRGNGRFRGDFSWPDSLNSAQEASA